MERYEQMLSHFEALLAYKGEYIGVREMRSHASWYTHGLYGSAKESIAPLRLMNFDPSSAI